jgi:hypothetical protein
MPSRFVFTSCVGQIATMQQAVQEATAAFQVTQQGAEKHAPGVSFRSTDLC